MIQQFKFFLGAVLILPFLPLLLWQGKRTRAGIPDLPEAIGKRKGIEGSGDPDFHILILGESTMAGVGVVNQKDGIARQLAFNLARRKKRAINWQVIAKSGYNAKKVRDELVPLIPDTPLDVVVIGLSVNDVIERNSPLSWKKDLTELLRAIRAKQSCPIVVANRAPVEYFPAFPWTFQVILGNLIKLNWQVIQDLPDRFAQFYLMNKTIRLEEWKLKADVEVAAKEFFSDGVHPSKLTYRLWAEEIADFIISRNILPIRGLPDESQNSK